MESVKSVCVTHFGGYDSIKVIDMPLLPLESNQVEVTVHYCGVNFADLYTRQGLMPRAEFPFVLGMECSGVITTLGSSIKNNFKIGDRVVCYNYLGGMYREKIRISTDKCYKIPDFIELKTAATVFVQYLTAYFCLFELGNLRSGQHILIHSCAGGVGSAASQLAKQVNDITIYGTASLHKAPELKQNGIIALQYDTYKEKINEMHPDGLDLIIDNQAGDNFDSNLELLGLFGKLILIGANNIIRNENQLDSETLQELPINLSLSSLFTNNTSIAALDLGIVAKKSPLLVQKIFDKICKMIDEKKIKLKIDSEWPLEKVVDATKLLQERRNIGKVLLYTNNIMF